MTPRWITILRKVARIWSKVIVGLGILVFIAEIIETSSAAADPYPVFELLIPITLVSSMLGLAVAWKREGIGGALTVGSALVNLLVYLMTGRTRVGVVALILFPIVLPGLFFLICWWGSRRSSIS